MISVTKYQYDRFGRLTQLTDPMNQNESYTYDLNGNLTEKTDRNDSVHTFTYDALGKLLVKEVETPDGAGDEICSYTYTKTGNRHTATGGGITTTCKYDALGRLIKETETGGIEKTYTYDAANNRKTFILKQNGITKTNTSYNYDNMNRLWKVYENGILTATYTYDSNGNRQTLTYNASGNTTNYTYNLANNLVSLTNKKGTTTLSSYAYTYYLNGNQATKTDHTGKVTTYVYDDLGRLKSEAPQGESSIVYTYDDYSNRETMTVGGSVTSYLYDKNNRLLTESKTESGIDDITRYFFDNNGNQICKTTETIEPVQSGSTESYNMYAVEGSLEQDVALNKYDGFNQLKKVITGMVIAEYQYNADGQRITKTVNSTETRHIWDGQNIAVELTGSAMTTRYIRGINLICSNMAGTVAAGLWTKELYWNIMIFIEYS
jgi:YD repeat-containing protein